MSPGEIAWRMRSRLRSVVDGALAPARARPIPAVRVCRVAPGMAATAGDEQSLWRREVVSQALPEPGVLPTGLAEAEGWREWLRHQADQLCAHRLTLFDLEDHPLGTEIRWNYEYKAQRPTPLIRSPRIDYRDYAETGDCKFVWEPSRHQHWVVLGRAYRLTGDAHYAQEVIDQLESWSQACPFGYGMQWRSPLELAIRLINWVWALELIRPSGLLTPERMDRITGLAWRHLWAISRDYSRYSSANNHLVGEAAGVFIGSSYFACLHDAPRWQAQSREILIREIFNQTHADGGSREQATGYHLFVLEFFLLAGLVGRRVGLEFPEAYWKRLEAMLDFLAVLTEGGSLPMFGDADDGYVLDLGGRDERSDTLLAIGAVLRNRPEWKRPAPHVTEPVYWLLGESGCQTLAAMKEPAEAAPLTSKALPESGYYLLQAGRRGQDDAVSVIMDCGPLGMGPIAAHGHADALSFVLRVAGWDILVDPGTYDYFTFRPWRDYFRSTRAHNTIVVDGRDQTQPLGLFLWGRPAQARVLAWKPREQGGRICGEHDGYQHRRGRRGVLHRRTLELDAAAGNLIIDDELEGAGAHVCEMNLHLGEGCEVEADGDGRFTIVSGRTTFSLELAPCWQVALLRGSEDPIAGWVSRGYHRKTPAYTVSARCRWHGMLRSRTRLSWTVNDYLEAAQTHESTAVVACSG